MASVVAVLTCSVVAVHGIQHSHLVIALHGFIAVGLLTFTCCLHEARAGAGQGFLYGLSWLLSTKKHTVILGRY